MKLAIFSGLLAGASAFSVQQLPQHASSLSMADVAEAVEVAEVAEDVEVAAEETSDDYDCISKEEILSSPNCIEMAVVWDPLKLADAGGDETLAWFRHAEVKHGRVAMAAFVGWWAVASGIHFPGSLSTGLPFESIPTQGLQAWEAVPGIGKVQMLLFSGLIELCDEYFHSTKGTHYLRGGTPGKNMVPGLYDPFGFSASRSEEELSRGRDVEIKNGRLAMIGIMGLLAESSIEGSVPLQPFC